MTTEPINLDALNGCDVDAFTAILGGIFEHSPWVAQAAYTARPFASVTALHAVMVSVVAHSGPERQLALLRAHPELARPAPLTAASSAEQGGMGLDRLAGEEAALFDARNADYRTKFGFPFIVAVRGQRDRTAILAAMTERLTHTPQQEMAAALAEVARIARFRLDDRITSPKIGRLTVHVLDTGKGCPAVGMGVSLCRLDGEARTSLGVWRTNDDGRCDSPLLAGSSLIAGTYEIVFDVGAWKPACEPGFYNRIPIRFLVADPTAHYHIPLLLSPFGYTTYRGS